MWIDHGLDTQTHGEIRAATELLTDTGHRPEETCALPWDCLARDSDRSPVLVMRTTRRTGVHAACRSPRGPPG